MRKYSLLLLFFLTLVSGVFAQLPGVSRHGSVKSSGDVFIDRYGEKVVYPRLNQYGQILYYAPLVVTDSVKLSDTVVTTACFYGEVVFDGWSSVLTCGFDYAASLDFSGSQRVACVAGVGRMDVRVSGLSYNQQYYVRAFATNRYGTSFADTLSFHTTVGPVKIASAQAEIQTPYSFDVAVLLEERGGLPVSGNIAIFADEACHHLVAEEPVENLTSNQVVRPFSDLEPATTYYTRAILSNGLFSDTVFLKVRTPSDLVLSIEADKASSVSLCTGGTSVTYTAVLMGLDRNKPYYDFHWTVSTGDGAVHDTAFSVSYETAGAYVISVKAFYGKDTIVASVEQTITPRSGNSSFYVCTNEFLNTAEATTTNIASIRWLDESREVVAATKSVKLPTGYYTVECTDGYGCVLSKEVYVGKKRLSCVVENSLGGNESGHFEDGVWKIDSVSDEDGYWYAVTQIGNLCWLRQNLRTRHLPSTHQDLLGTGYSGSPDMYYLITTPAYVYNPDVTPYEGAKYTWCAAVDVQYTSYNNTCHFPNQHRGICPEGWHLPQKKEVWEVVDTMLHLYCEGVDAMPAVGRDNGVYVAQNTPISNMFWRTCYESLASPAYPESLYDATHLSFSTTLNTTEIWLIDLSPAEMSAQTLCLSQSYTGVSIGVGIRTLTYLPVRCVRDYPEE